MKLPAIDSALFPLRFDMNRELPPADARIHSIDEIGRAVIATHDSVPVTINDVAKVRIGRQFRTGSASKNGREVAIGTALMLTGENSRTVATAVREKFLQIRNNLPPGIVAAVLLDRSQLVNATITTVGDNLAIGALLVTATRAECLSDRRSRHDSAVRLSVAGARHQMGFCDFGRSFTLASLMCGMASSIDQMIVCGGPSRVSLAAA
jgi:Cu/Ag efflux pump CusA